MQRIIVLNFSSLRLKFWLRVTGLRNKTLLPSLVNPLDIQRIIVLNFSSKFIVFTVK